jgi:hypothetical protein
LAIKGFILVSSHTVFSRFYGDSDYIIDLHNSDQGKGKSLIQSDHELLGFNEYILDAT